jgi:hypothetical protein
MRMVWLLEQISPLVAIEVRKRNAPVRGLIVNRNLSLRYADRLEFSYFVEAYQYSIKYRMVISKG